MTLQIQTQSSHPMILLLGAVHKLRLHEGGEGGSPGCKLVQTRGVSRTCKRLQQHHQIPAFVSVAEFWESPGRLFYSPL